MARYEKDAKTGKWKEVEAKKPAVPYIYLGMGKYMPLPEKKPVIKQVTVKCKATSFTELQHPVQSPANYEKNAATGKWVKVETTAPSAVNAGTIESTKEPITETVYVAKYDIDYYHLDKTPYHIELKYGSGDCRWVTEHRPAPIPKNARVSMQVKQFQDAFNPPERKIDPRRKHIDSMPSLEIRDVLNLNEKNKTWVPPKDRVPEGFVQPYEKEVDGVLVSIEHPEILNAPKVYEYLPMDDDYFQFLADVKKVTILNRLRKRKWFQNGRLALPPKVEEQRDYRKSPFGVVLKKVQNAFKFFGNLKSQFREGH